ncbi:hypothetical protein CHUAL_009010 [Chamberlinius hualienensis]
MLFNFGAFIIAASGPRRIYSQSIYSAVLRLRREKVLFGMWNWNQTETETAEICEHFFCFEENPHPYFHHIQLSSAIIKATEIEEDVEMAAEIKEMKYQNKRLKERISSLHFQLNTLEENNNLLTEERNELKKKLIMY